MAEKSILRYKTILADPPWEQKMTGKWKREPNRRAVLPYPTMGLEEIKRLPVGKIADIGCHLWLWVTNAFLRQGFEVMEAWGFNYLVPITWVKPSGLGNWFVHTTQHILFGYKERCRFPLGRYKPTAFCASAGGHSQKPEESYELIESISPEPRLELFARHKRKGWDVWGNEVQSDIALRKKETAPPEEA